MSEGNGPIVWAVDTLRRITGNRLHLLIVAATLLAFTLSYWLAYLIRFEFLVPPPYAVFMASTLPYILLIKLVVFYYSGIYKILWAYIGLKDLYRILMACAFATGLVAVVNQVLFPWQSVPRSVLVADGLFTFLSVGGIYACLRSLREANARAEGRPVGSLEPAFIVGAGDAGEALLRELQRNRASAIRVVGFLDDAPEKSGTSLRGVKILGRVEDAARLSAAYGAKKAFIAIPSAGGADLRRIVTSLLSAKVAMKVLPPLTNLSSEAGFATQLREVSIEDLLRREPVRLDMAAISGSIRDKVVLVTGAAGSIGSELCRQILEQNPARLVALDIAETPLQGLLLELGGRAKGEALLPELADVTDDVRIREIFRKHRPAVVFHAAALKHVPLMESQPREAVRVNIQGTRIVAEASRAEGVGSFILISTDKAVNPSSVMGATKRLAELLLLSLAEEGKGPTRFMAVRFGNVLGSSGSVLPIFKAQLARGGPLTVTHPEMRRYFMTIPEAVQLVLQASVLGRGSEVFMLDMGEPIYIKDFAADLIRLSGLVPDVDVKIEYSGIRPGEKLHEDLRFDAEKMFQTPHAQIYGLRANAEQEEAWRGAVGDYLAQSPAPGVFQARLAALLNRT
jgi:FlaA1/EpsC-like NDP-sugar epimerase